MALLKLGLVLAVLLMLLRRGVPLTWAMLGASLGLGVLFALPPLTLVNLIIGSVSSSDTISLALAVALIMLLDGLFRESGLMRTLVDSLLGLLGDRRPALAALPALIGFLPSPAWARFLAPVVEELCEGSGATPQRKAFISYWYQHVTTYVSPLFPSLVLAAQLASLPVGSLIVALAPVAAFAMAVGAPVAFRLRPMVSARIETGLPRAVLALGLVRGLLPIAAVVGLVLLRVNVAVALLVVAIGLAFAFRIEPRRLASVARRSVVPLQVLMVVAIMVFKDVLVSTGSLQEVPKALSLVGAPSLIAMLGIALLATLLTGGSQAGIAMALPLLVTLPGGSAPEPVALVFVWALTGLMLSPAHPCLGLTLGHFDAQFGPVQRLVVAPQLLVAAVATAMYLLRSPGW